MMLTYKLILVKKYIKYYLQLQKYHHECLFISHFIIYIYKFDK